ncbi:MAG: hypothetical protein QOK25_2388 [Thermoleophilaceae bacterium]|nr:hypothetical protein [Thermoleophilaceae bacterium]
MTRRVLTALSLSACIVLGASADAGARVQLRVLHPEVKLQHPAGVFKTLHKASKTKKAKKKKVTAGPSVSSIAPMQAKVGEKLTVLGKGFISGKTSIYFLRAGGGVVIAKPDTTSTTRMVVTIPDTVTPLLRAAGAAASPTLFQVRILAKRFGATTKKDRSPVIGPADGVPSTGGGGGGGTTGCKPSDFPNGTPTDTDGDLIPNTTEINVTHTDPCNPDTDGDGISDGYEYQSALDMNNTTPFGTPDAALPYPGKKPWPNPLDPTDANTDHDGDGLTMADEYQLWTYYGAHSLPLNYSDGKQRSVAVAAPVDPVLDYMDHDKFPNYNWHILSDDERDADGDGLGNWDERYGRMTQSWWDAEFSGSNGFPRETRYPQTFPGVSMVDPDTDGDGVLDGADDQDHDGLSNAFEISRPWDWKYTYVSNGHSGPAPQDYQDYQGQSGPGPVPVGVGPNPWARVQPYNPCKPLFSTTCPLHPDFGYYGQGEDWVGPDPANVGTQPAAPWLWDPNDIHLSGGE